MKKLFFAVAAGVILLNVVLFAIMEVRHRRYAESMSAREISLQERHVSSASELPAVDFAHYPEVSAMAEAPDPIHVPETPEYDDFSTEELDQLIAFADECCPDDSYAGSSDEESLTWQERLRRRLVKAHGDIPEIDRYIELATIQRDGGTMTVSEVLEHDELAARLEPSAANDRRLADTREIARDYGPNASVSVSRSYGGDPTPKHGTTVTETTHEPD